MRLLLAATVVAATAERRRRWKRYGGKEERGLIGARKRRSRLIFGEFDRSEEEDQVDFGRI